MLKLPESVETNASRTTVPTDIALEAPSIRHFSKPCAETRMDIASHGMHPQDARYAVTGA